MIIIGIDMKVYSGDADVRDKTDVTCIIIVLFQVSNHL